MKKFLRDFITIEDRQYSIKIGKTVASSLTGFLIGAISAHLVWYSAVKQIFNVLGIN